MPPSSPAPQPFDDALGVLLAGGVGRRMGRDKVFVELECPVPGGEGAPARTRHIAMGTAVLEAMAPCCPQLRIGVARGTLNARRELPGRLGFPSARLLEDRHADCGAVAGLIAALEEGARLSARAVFVAACDYPLLTPRAVRGLLESFFSCGDEALLPKGGEQEHPLCGVWSPRALPGAISFHDNGGRSLCEFAGLAGARWLPVETLAGPQAFFNVNTPGDVREAERLLAGAMLEQWSGGREQ